MKKRSFLILFVSALLSVNAAERQVYLFSSFMDPAKDGLHYLYSYDGLHWNALKGSWLKPEIGNKSLYWDYEASKWAEPKYYGEPLMRDPSITQGPDGTYHLVWTMSWMGDKGFAYSSSKDLIHWTHQREIVVMKDSVTNNVWAPEVLYDSKKQQFIIAWSSSIPPKRYTTEDKKGTNSCHRLYYTITKDFQTFAATKPLYDPGFNSIDGYFVKRGENDFVLILKDNRKPGYSNLFTAFANQIEGPYSNPSQKFGQEYSEGPACIKVGYEWIIYYDIYREKRYGAVSTKDFRTFTDITDKISIPSGFKHGTMLLIPESVLENLKKQAEKK